MARPELAGIFLGNNALDGIYEDYFDFYWNGGFEVLGAGSRLRAYNLREPALMATGITQGCLARIKCSMRQPEARQASLHSVVRLLHHRKHVLVYLVAFQTAHRSGQTGKLSQFQTSLAKRTGGSLRTSRKNMLTSI